MKCPSGGACHDRDSCNPNYICPYSKTEVIDSVRATKALAAVGEINKALDEAEAHESWSDEAEDVYCILKKYGFVK